MTIPEVHCTGARKGQMIRLSYDYSRISAYKEPEKAKSQYLAMPNCQGTRNWISIGFYVTLLRVQLILMELELGSSGLQWV